MELFIKFKELAEIKESKKLFSEIEYICSNLVLFNIKMLFEVLKANIECIRLVMLRFICF